MFFTLLGMFFGMVVGFLVGGSVGGGLGALIGGVAGGLLASLRPVVGKIAGDTPLTCDKQSVMCETKGRVAEATFVRNAENGQWLDVAGCTLCTPQEEISCEKRCLVLMRDVAPTSQKPAHA